MFPVGEITSLLSDLEQGDSKAEAKLMPLVYEHLRRIAAQCFRRERPGNTLQPTALVHEAYLRMMQPGKRQWKNRAHFFGIAALAMRQVLVDHARANLAQKRGGRPEKVILDDMLIYEPARAAALLDLDDALSRLKELDERQSRIVELRYFAGLSVKETAEVLHVGQTTVKDEWKLAKAWLQRELKKNA